MTAWPGIGALAGLLACAHTAPAAAQTSSVPPTRALASTLEAIVNEDAYAGIVAKLEPIVGLETTYPVSAVFSQPRWYVRLRSLGSPTRALLAVHEDAWRHLDGTGPRLVDARGSVCLALLRRPVHRVYAGSFHHVFIAVTADAMGRTPRFGTVGSGACTPSSALHTILVIASGPTFMDALDQAVQQAGGVAWPAAENGRGQCGIGFVAPAQPIHGAIYCVGTVTVEQPPTSPLPGSLTLASRVRGRADAPRPTLEHPLFRWQHALLGSRPRLSVLDVYSERADVCRDAQANQGGDRWPRVGATSGRRLWMGSPNSSAGSTVE